LGKDEKKKKAKNWGDVGGNPDRSQKGESPGGRQAKKEEGIRVQKKKKKFTSKKLKKGEKIVQIGR